LATRCDWRFTTEPPRTRTTQRFWGC